MYYSDTQSQKPIKNLNDYIQKQNSQDLSCFQYKHNIPFLLGVTWQYMAGSGKLSLKQINN